MKQVSVLLFFFIFPIAINAQLPDSGILKKDSVIIVDTNASRLRDSAVIQQQDSSAGKPDSALVRNLDTNMIRIAAYNNSIQKILKDNQLLNSAGEPAGMANQLKKRNYQDSFFYLAAFIAMILGCLRFFYTRYFNNLFRVFFNASLRQSQLTDQLLLAKWPSLFFNLLYIIIGGVYAYLLLRYYEWISPNGFWLVLFYCVVSLGAIYLVKYCTLKFTGWLTGYDEITNTYIFIIFLINKILGILLIPFSIVIAFSLPSLSTIAIIISLLLIGLMYLLRFFRSYGLLQQQLKVSRFHFLMYVVGVEIVPVLLIYKALLLLLSKNI